MMESRASESFGSNTINTMARGQTVSRRAFSWRSFDFMAYIDQDGKFVSNSMSMFASVFAAMLMTTMWTIAFFVFFTLDPHVNVKIRDLTNEVKAHPPSLGTPLAAAGDQNFMNQSYVLWVIKYRVIYQGFSNPDKPELMIDVPTYNCQNDNGIQLGYCPNYTALNASLLEVREKVRDRIIETWEVSDIPEYAMLQGTFGDEKYAFLELELHPCAWHAEEIEGGCAPQEELNTLIKSEVHFNLWWLENISSSRSKWNNIYEVVRTSEAKAYEVHFRHMMYRSFRGDVPFWSVRSTGLKFERHSVRTYDSTASQPLAEIYIRLDTNVEEQVTEPKTIFILGTEVGGGRTIAIIIASFGLALANLRIRTVHREDDDQQAGSRADFKLRAKALSHSNFVMSREDVASAVQRGINMRRNSGSNGFARTRSSPQPVSHLAKVGHDRGLQAAGQEGESWRKKFKEAQEAATGMCRSMPILRVSEPSDESQFPNPIPQALVADIPGNPLPMSPSLDPVVSAASPIAGIETEADSVLTPVVKHFVV